MAKIQYMVTEDYVRDWQIPEAALNMAPDPVLERAGAEDRMQVEVYFLDDYDPSRPPQFRVLYEGEVVGWGYRKASRNRQVAFPCVNQFAIFTQLTVQMLTNVDDMAAQAVEPGRGVAGVAPTRSELVFPYSLGLSRRRAPAWRPLLPRCGRMGGERRKHETGQRWPANNNRGTAPQGDHSGKYVRSTR